jgi:hypothetical protein
MHSTARTQDHTQPHTSIHEVVLAVRSNAAGGWEVVCDRGKGSFAQFKYRDDAFIYALQLAQREQQARVDLYRGDGRLVSSDHYRQHRH